MSGLQVFIQGVGLLGPGLPSWAQSQAVLRGEAAHQFALSTLPAPPRLPPAERRRAGPVIRLAMAVAEEAIAHADVDPQTLASVFTSSGGEGANCHSLCETLASANPLISPTRFTNSVHNAASGYWHIAVGSRQASTSLCAYNGSFGAGLIEACTQMQSTGEAVLLVAYDLPYPEPLNAVRPLLDNFGLALLLTPHATPRTLAGLSVALQTAAADAAQTHAAGLPTRCIDAGLETLRGNLPAAAALPLAERLARRVAGDMTLVYLPHLNLRLNLQFAAPQP